MYIINYFTVQIIRRIQKTQLANILKGFILFIYFHLICRDLVDDRKKAVQNFFCIKSYDMKKLYTMYSETYELAYNVECFHNSMNFNRLIDC